MLLVNSKMIYLQYRVNCKIIISKKLIKFTTYSKYSVSITLTDTNNYLQKHKRRLQVQMLQKYEKSGEKFNKKYPKIIRKL